MKGCVIKDTFAETCMHRLILGAITSPTNQTKATVRKVRRFCKTSNAIPIEQRNMITVGIAIEAI